MQAFTFKKNTIHHRLAATYGPMSKWASETDVCEYTHAVLKGLLGVLLIIFVSGLFAAGYGDMFAWIAAMVVNWTYIEPDGGAVLMSALTGAVAFVTACFYIGPKIKAAIAIAAAKSENFVEKQPGFIKVAYRSFKDKYCVPVKLVTDGE